LFVHFEAFDIVVSTKLDDVREHVNPRLIGLRAAVCTQPSTEQT